MTTYKDIMGSGGNRESIKNMINGAFACGHCTEVSTEAEHDRDNRLLVWICKEGHRNEASFSV